MIERIVTWANRSQERLRLLRLAYGDDAFEVIGDGFKVGRRRPASDLVPGREEEFRCWAEVFEARLEPGESEVPCGCECRVALAVPLDADLHTSGILLVNSGS